VLLVTALASAVLGWFISGWVLRPVSQMTETARTLSAGNLGGRLALTGPDDEFKRLGDTFDDLLSRLQAAFEAQRRFVANASHELRTPLTVERTLLQVALADPDATAATLRATCEELLASGRDQELLLEALLTLATSERGLDRADPVDLAALAGRALDGARPEIERRGLAITAELSPAAATGDAALLERLAANLIDNATRYNRARGSIEIRTGSDDEGAWLTVANPGPLVGAGEVDRLFEPFQRLGRDRIEAPDGHHGLGLSIVRAIVTAHGGTVEAVARPDGGLTITVRLSRSPALPRTSGSPVAPPGTGGSPASRRWRWPSWRRR